MFGILKKFFKKERPTSIDEVTDLLMDGKIIAIFQGKSEVGPRALGNRSLLFDPRNPNAKEYVNEVKRRESFRPFAATILLEHAHEWFEMEGLKDSPFMMFSLKVKEDKKHLIPGVLHVDDTCRIQTLTREQNSHYYDLIWLFYKKTGIPLVFNTSFNLAGETIVQSKADAYDVLRRSQIDYLYTPENKCIFSV